MSEPMPSEFFLFRPSLFSDYCEEHATSSTTSSYPATAVTAAGVGMTSPFELGLSRKLGGKAVIINCQLPTSSLQLVDAPHCASNLRSCLAKARAKAKAQAQQQVFLQHLPMVIPPSLQKEWKEKIPVHMRSKVRFDQMLIDLVRLRLDGEEPVFTVINVLKKKTKASSSPTLSLSSSSLSQSMSGAMLQTAVYCRALSALGVNVSPFAEIWDVGDGGDFAPVPFRRAEVDPVLEAFWKQSVPRVLGGVHDGDEDEGQPPPPPDTRPRNCLVDIEDVDNNKASLMSCATCPHIDECRPYPSMHSEASLAGFESEPSFAAMPSFAMFPATPMGRLVPSPTTAKKRMVQCVDGNQAAATVAYAFCDSAFVFPITPSSPMGELVDEWAAAGLKNCFDQIVQVNVMQSEGGAAGAMHGALLAGTMATTFTASQGLLLMIPNMYKIAGELLPCVMHVSARTVSTHSLSIFGDHSDIIGVKQTGWTMLCSDTAQSAYDLAIVSHLATLDSRIPVVHFFDGFRTSHEISKIEVLQTAELKELIPADLIRAHRDRALHPNHPVAQGGVVGPEGWFQVAEASNPFYQAAPAKLEKWLETIASVTGRKYNFFDYSGHAEAEHIVIVMGSAGLTVDEYCKAHPEEKIGVIKVRVFRPWSKRHLLQAIPQSTKMITVLDRVKDPTADGEPLLMDVCASLHRGSGRFSQIEAIGGRYGLSMKEFTPDHVAAVYENMRSEHPRDNFTVGIVDDVTFLSLHAHPTPDILPPNTKQCVFFGLGSDGTVGANKTAIKMIGEGTANYAQGFFEYDSKKSGSLTISHLRFGPNPINAPYVVVHADYVAIHNERFVQELPKIISKLKHGGMVVLNTLLQEDELESALPAGFKRDLAQRNANFYIINAQKLAKDIGLGKKINMIMQTVFFYLTKVIPFEEASSKLKGSIAKMFRLKGQHIIDMNQRAVDDSLTSLQQIKIPAEWGADGKKKSPTTAIMKPLRGGDKKPGPRRDFIEDVVFPVNTQRGNDVPVSKFAPGGTLPTGTSFSEKRGIAPQVPLVDMDKCTQCNYCSLVCPHAAIRPFLLTPQETDAAPETVRKTAKPALGGGMLDNFNYRIQVSPFDCVGCDLCFKICPSDAIKMRPFQAALDDGEEQNWNYVAELPEHGSAHEKTTVKGSQFQRPLMEFSGACPGCGETAYVKLLTQLFGEKLVLANATGCSAVWGASVSVPYAVNSQGIGPAFGHSLFEDAAEFGYGLLRGQTSRIDQLLAAVDRALEFDNETSQSSDSFSGTPSNKLGIKIMSEALRRNLEQFAALRHGRKRDTLLIQGKSSYKALSERIIPLLQREKKKHPLLQEIWDDRDYFMRLSMWTVGGDGWAYDIGFGGLDQVLSSGNDVKCLVLDTEMYSNTGGQISKASNLGVLQKFASAGKPVGKKDLGRYAMSTYRNVYVASICINANHQQSLRAFLEAEAHPGPAIIIAYCPCITHGYLLTDAVTHCKQAVESGYWPLYRYNPELAKSGTNPFQLDSKKITSDLSKMLGAETRFTALARRSPDVAAALNAKLKEEVHARAKQVQFLSKYTVDSTPETSGKKNGAVILYGSETGNAEDLAWQLASDLEVRGLRGNTVSALDDFEFSELANVQLLLIVTSTCGLGEFPQNSKKFWTAISDEDLSITLLSQMKYAVFGLGDSTYAQFCYASEKIDQRMAALGATRLMPRGQGDDRDEDRYYTAWEKWAPTLFSMLQLPQLPIDRKPPPPTFDVEVVAGGPAPVVASLVPVGAIPLVLKEVVKLTPDDYDRDIRHYEFDLTTKKGAAIRHSCGDSLAVFPKNDRAKVVAFCDMMGYNPTDELRIAPAAGAGGGGKNAAGIPPEVSIFQLFSIYLNIFGKPSKKFFEQLLCFSTDEAEIAALSGDTGKLYRDMCEDYATYADVLKKFKKSRPPLAHLVSIIPLIKPRSYSISSSPLLHPNVIQLTIVKVDWKVPSSGDVRDGLCTGYMTKLKSGDLVNVALRKSAIVVPQDVRVPIIMAGMGTGVAPWRAMVQQRIAEKTKEGKAVGPAVLFFGARYSKKEFLYEAEFHRYEHTDNVLQLHTAFSRDQPQKVYVQHRILEEGAKLIDFIMNKGAYFYVCGSSVNIPEEVFSAVKKVMMTHGDMDQDQAEQYLANMRQEGRYIVEAW